MPGVSALLTLLAGVLATWGVAHLMVSRADASGTVGGAGFSDHPGARLAAGATVGIVLALVAPATSLPMYVAAAAVAALGTAAAIGTAHEVGTSLGGPAYAIPSLRPCPASTRGGISAAAAAAGAAGAFVTVTVAFGVRLLGPSDGGLVFLAAIFGMLLEHRLEGAWYRHGPASLLPPVIAGLAAAGLAAVAVVLLP